MAEMREAKAERIQMFHESIQHRRMLPNLLALADNLLLGAIVEAATTSMEQVAALLTDDTKARGVFHCQATFGNDAGQFVFSPSQADVRTALADNEAGIVEVRSSPPPVHAACVLYAILLHLFSNDERI